MTVWAIARGAVVPSLQLSSPFEPSVAAGPAAYESVHVAWTQLTGLLMLQAPEPGPGLNPVTLHRSLTTLLHAKALFAQRRALAERALQIAVAQG